MINETVAINVLSDTGAISELIFRPSSGHMDSGENMDYMILCQFYQLDKLFF